MNADEVRRRIGERFPELSLVPAGAWIVGGAIRDARLGREAPDLDLALADAAAAAAALARRAGGRLVRLGGERFESTRVVVGDRTYDLSELTGGGIEADLARRDFTINAIGLPVWGPPRLEDPHGGALDLDRRLVRMISRANLRDDPLRIVKAGRLAATLRFAIEPETLAACRELAPAIESVAAERIGAEVQGILAASDPAISRAFLRETGLDLRLFGREAPAALSRIRRGDPAVAVAVVFRGAPTGEAAAAVRNLRWPAVLAAAARAVLELDAKLSAASGSARELDLLLFDAGGETAIRTAEMLDAFGDLALASAIRQRIAVRGSELFATEALLSGDEIAALRGISPGPEVGRLKRALLEAQIRGEVRTRDEAEAWIAAVAP